MSIKDLYFDLPTGKIAVQQFGNGATPIIALHGWLDNSGSFCHLAPLLGDATVFSVDLPGHGLSYHHAPNQPLHATDALFDLMHLLNALDFSSYVLLGHSMGGALAAFFTAAFPDRVSKLICLDVMGPLAEKPEDAPLRLAQSVEKYCVLPHKNLPLYPSIDAAQKRRSEFSNIEYDALTPMILRGTKVTPSGITWRTDPRLTWPESYRYSESHIEAILRKIKCPTLFIGALQSNFFEHSLLKKRLNFLSNATAVWVEGGHHVHLEHPERVAPHLRDFLRC